MVKNFLAVFWLVEIGGCTGAPFPLKLHVTKTSISLTFPLIQRKPKLDFEISTTFTDMSLYVYEFHTNKTRNPIFKFTYLSQDAPRSPWYPQEPPRKFWGASQEPPRSLPGPTWVQNGHLTEFGIQPFQLLVTNQHVLQSVGI